ncbi:hypothetical protein DEU56DRAFT_836949, partial [Suillus clintonianus]|uniref:uncharacterized protein n=1 Tax=Suillus clintonianus TaxID=1904413 RepID=UPI001B86A1A1
MFYQVDGLALIIQVLQHASLLLSNDCIVSALSIGPVPPPQHRHHPCTRPRLTPHPYAVLTQHRFLLFIHPIIKRELTTDARGVGWKMM